MTSEHQLPLPDNSVQRILIVHALEHAENPRQFLREVWRVLDPAGSVLLIVPSRSGLWAHAEHTPFGHGRPYSESQLKTLLEDNMFTCRKARAALFLPPTQRRFLIKTADIWEGLGALVPFWGGVSLAAAEKTLYAAATTGSAPPPVFATAVE
jgi:SAM-dependent methyltransferase